MWRRRCQGIHFATDILVVLLNVSHFDRFPENHFQNKGVLLLIFDWTNPAHKLETFII